MLMQNSIQAQTQNTTPLGSPPRDGLDGQRLLFDGYPKHPTAWDELFEAAGRPHEFCSGLV